MNIYVELTRQFNVGRLRAILSSGQAVVLHHLAVMSKDGDWLLQEDDEALEFVLNVLDSYGASYRFGAPLDKRWHSGGWSSHFEFKFDKIRVRTDFVCRPPRIAPARLADIWIEQAGREFPFVDLIDLIELKKTNREKDYVIIGEIARRIVDIDNKLRYSRSAKELIQLCELYPDAVARIASERTILNVACDGLEKLEKALDAERRRLIHENEHRLNLYRMASGKWADAWKGIEREIRNVSLTDAHKCIVEQALDLLPFGPVSVKEI